MAANCHIGDLELSRDKSLSLSLSLKSCFLFRCLSPSLSPSHKHTNRQHMVSASESQLSGNKWLLSGRVPPCVRVIRANPLEGIRCTTPPGNVRLPPLSPGSQSILAHAKWHNLLHRLELFNHPKLYENQQTAIVVYFFVAWHSFNVTLVHLKIEILKCIHLDAFTWIFQRPKRGGSTYPEAMSAAPGTHNIIWRDRLNTEKYILKHLMIFNAPIFAKLSKKPGSISTQITNNSRTNLMHQNTLLVVAILQ